MMNGAAQFFQVCCRFLIINSVILCQLFAKSAEFRRNLFRKKKSFYLFRMIFFQLFYRRKTADCKFIVFLVFHILIIADFFYKIYSIILSFVFMPIFS